MPKNRPRCHCGAQMKRNGTTSKGTTRQRCTTCGASRTKPRPNVTNAAGGSLIIATTTTHVIAWYWRTHETTDNYRRLMERILATLIAVINGGRGANNAITTCSPTTTQRCLVHTQRVVRATPPPDPEPTRDARSTS